MLNINRVSEHCGFDNFINSSMDRFSSRANDIIQCVRNNNSYRRLNNNYTLGKSFNDLFKFQNYRNSLSPLEL